MKRLLIILVPLLMLAVIGGLVGYLFSGSEDPQTQTNPPPPSTTQSNTDFDSAYKQSVADRAKSGDAPIAATPPPAPINKSLSFSAAQQRQAIALIDNYVSLYNSYGYDDYGNIYAVGDYSTVTMQNAIVGYIDELENTVRPGFLRQSTTNPSTALLTAAGDVRHLKASIAGVAVEGQNGVQTSRPFVADLILATENNRWYVDSINIVAQ